MFSSDEELEAESLLGEAFDAYKEQLTLYKSPRATVVASAGYNFAFGLSQPSIAATHVTQSGVFYGTIEYTDTRDGELLSAPSVNTPISQPKGWVRLSVSGAAAGAFLEASEVFVIDGKDFHRQSDVLRRGLFTRDGWECWLQKIDNG